MELGERFVVVVVLERRELGVAPAMPVKGWMMLEQASPTISL
jgi:hypothetical protein